VHLYLIRHGQSPVNLADWPHGNSDEGLTALGRRQAAAVAGRLAGELDGVDALYTSTMRRARETADAVARALAVGVVDDDRIREIGNNRLDHSPWPDLPTDYGDFWSTERPFASVTPAYERGESLMHFRTRIGAFLEHLWAHHAGGTVVTVTHGGVIDAVFDHLFNVGPWRRCQVWTANAALTHVEALPVEGGHPGPERWRLHRHNCVAHLVEVRAAPSVAGGAPSPLPDV
jgi:broad specificity phosphatase PhoE